MNEMDAGRSQQYAEGQLLPRRGVWAEDDPHVTYVDFYEWGQCYHKAVRRKLALSDYVRRRAEFDRLCREFPLYWERFKRGEKPTLND